MRTVYPDYYKDFCCTASACRHTCCAGWEIDIDRASMRRYAAAEGDLGRRLRAGIAGGENPHFVLTEGGRWTALLEGLREVDGADVAEFDRRYPQTLREYENLLWYFFYRHFLSAADGGSVAAPLRFAAVSWQIIHALDAAKFKRAGAFAPADRAEHARLYSAEIEYSDENMEAMLELLQ